jgi:hypothetical protein
MGIVEVWQEPNRFWRWRYVEPSPTGVPPVELYSNEVYEFKEQAARAARAAYPGIAVMELERPPEVSPQEERRREGSPRLRRAMMAVLGAMVVLLLLRMRRRRQARAR